MSLRARIEARAGSLALDVAIDTAPGTLVVVGPNGAGKSTLLACLLGARPVARGRVAIGDEVLLDTEAGVDVPLERRRLGYVPQDYALLPHLSARENVAFALACASPREARDARARRADAALEGLGLAALADRRADALSGGEKQRVALARALAVAPRALLLDEPLAALDARARSEVRARLARTLEDAALPTVIVTHDAEDARLLGHRVAVLEAGRVVQAGTFEELAARPATRFVEELVASARA